jgi:hypothetical protein
MHCDNSSPSVSNCIIAFSAMGRAITCESGGAPILTCCDIYGNRGGDWVGRISDQLGINGNFSFDPLFCDDRGDDFHLDCSSPCAPAHQPDCGLIGAWDVGCGPSRTEAMTWGAVKAMYRW